ncbi:hypothetical protein [Ktedonospora formicarum]|uniref:Uncharacterized protein n=1 Tax=Ktedonospora formicarum TaxID=2778364 RepID=A0A8J3MWI4_9CHLR|nr:hypothetical protein [Ktedonospora formicarum]GHO48688.1 hypothetical protein KSX_68510 [Ktedonospora formicarum]
MKTTPKTGVTKMKAGMMRMKTTPKMGLMKWQWSRVKNERLFLF